MGPYFVIGHDYREKVNKITKTILKHNISEVNDMIFNALIKRHNYELVKYYIDSGCCINNVDWSTAIYCITSYKILLKNNRVKTLYNNTFYKYKIINYIMRIDVDRYLRCNYRHPQYVVLIKELLKQNPDLTWRRATTAVLPRHRRTAFRCHTKRAHPPFQPG